jgi:hypothetical protein
LQIYTCGIITAFKVKGSVLLMNMSSGFDRMVVALGWWAVGLWYEYGGGPTATGKFT